MTTRTALTTCPLCEATCGLELTITDDRITGVRGDRLDEFSGGFLCPKGASLGQLDADPDRLTTPLVKRDGVHVPVSWAEAFEVVRSRLTAIMAEHGRDAVAMYLGNPMVHSLAGGLYAGELRRALGSRNVFTASTVDQMPKHVSSGLMYGGMYTIPVPDIDRTDFLLLLGADPYTSNGSLWTAPDMPKRLKALRARGGAFVVVDPRRSRTAAAADQHVPITPGTDVFLLLAMAQELFAADLVDLGDLAPHVNGLDGVRELVAPFTPEAVADKCGIDAATIRALTHRFAAAERAAVYGRIGTTTVDFGTVASWLVDVLNALTGNLDRPGGSMFPLPAHLSKGRGSGKGFTTGRWRSRVRDLPEVASEFPAVTLADEIETPGEGQVRAFVTIAGNPALSLPNSARLEAALSTLDFMVSVDPYLNETTRHADVVLPPPPPSRRPHYDIAFLGFAVRNVAKFSPPVIPLDEGAMPEADILLRLAAVLGGLDPDTDLDAMAAEQLDTALAKLVEHPKSPLHGRTVEELRSALVEGTREERLLDLKLRTGSYGDWFGAVPDGLSMAKLLANPHGVDLGALEPRIPEVLRTPSGKVELCPDPIAADIPRVLDALRDRPDDLLLVGRRHLRSNNSWMHNVPALVKGKPTCTLLVNTADALRLGLTGGGVAQVSSRVGKVEATVEVTDDIASGVVSLPHGWGHDRPGTRTSVASAHAGVNVNLLTDDLRIDPLSGTAVLNGVRVHVSPAAD
ncbi:molybdopterin oxidoreductase family protein [Umezawaea sp. Da 62-37]|uniref:molybdopterin oxidoreductase family protein n=1 Tax=Umezawaea sp. Da 62-37 TaxID=3075927 RepID=UPI0028F72A00|nr:molybdopterin oxidoreductase family protein [Umezawaea sp. Da 62-37]WNV89368.1 molybdopterin oxidoreductase family protein [Umezawaea sp. Da 62-37]